LNYFIVKRYFDYGLSLLGLFLFFPFMVLIVWAILMEDGQPIFYVKKVLGLYGNVLNIFKFRSMKSGSLELTKAGKLLRQTAMDELPQLWTIVKGEMSFVGPRPYDAEKYGIYKNFKDKTVAPHSLDAEKAAFAQRLQTRPGLTGMAQVFVPKHATDEEVLRWDLKYIKENSFPLDLHLIFMSIYITFKRRWERIDKKL
jgi:lipopolysaccharide/colanic/teichoic acid biosynthesis glycosyltransferase